jgi:hypothetical protein
LSAKHTHETQPIDHLGLSLLVNSPAERRLLRALKEMIITVLTNGEGTATHSLAPDGAVLERVPQAHVFALIEYSLGKA